MAQLTSRCNSAERAPPHLVWTATAPSSLYISGFSLYFLGIGEHPFSLTQKGRLPPDGWEELACWTGTKRSFGDISNWHFFSWCLINSKMCWRLETSVSKTRCSSNEILIWQKYSAKLSSHTLCVERKSFKNCSAFPCPLLYSPCKQNGSTIWIWILSTYVVYLWEYDWANRQLFLHYSPLLHASSCKTSHLIAPCRILNRIFNGYEEMVGKNAKKKKMERRQSCHCQRSLTAEWDGNFQALCSTYSNFCWKTERIKKSGQCYSFIITLMDPFIGEFSC